MTTEPYVPIDCDRHSVLELLAMRRAPVIVRALDEAGIAYPLAGVVQDVFTRDRAEYLALRATDGVVHPIRLDRLRTLSGPDGAPLWRQENVGT